MLNLLLAVQGKIGIGIKNVFGEGACVEEYSCGLVV